MEEVSLDGSLGEGGGQVLRTSLALSIITRRPLCLSNIRARRPKPGLQPQHLAAVRAAARISSGSVTGDAIGSQQIQFSPGSVGAGPYAFDVGTAGSSTLVFQTVFLPLALSGGTVSAAFRGGTHNPWAPAFPYLDRVFLPAVRGIGLEGTLRLERAGWYPRGQGEFEARITPGQGPQPLRLENRGALQRVTCYSASSGLPEHVRQRQADHAAKRPRSRRLKARVEQEDLPSPGVGSVLFLLAEFDGCAAGFTGLGARGKPAERVADEACEALFAFLDVPDAPVDPHLADQIALPLALAAGESRYRTSQVTGHLLTNLHMIGQFLPIRWHVDAPEGQPGTVTIGQT